jgi:hypothetical protein
MAAPTGRDARYGKNDENNDLCFTIDDVVFFNSYVD